MNKKWKEGTTQHNRIYFSVHRTAHGRKDKNFLRSPYRTNYRIIPFLVANVINYVKLENIRVIM